MPINNLCIKIIICALLFISAQQAQELNLKQALDFIQTLEFKNLDSTNAKNKIKYINQAKQVIFKAMLKDKKLKENPQIYLKLAVFVYNYSSFFYIDEIRDYLFSYIKYGGNKNKLSQIFLFILESSEIEILLEQNLYKTTNFLLLSNENNFFIFSNHINGDKTCLKIEGKLESNICKNINKEDFLIFPFNKQIYILDSNKQQDKLFKLNTYIKNENPKSEITIFYKLLDAPKICLESKMIIPNNKALESKLNKLKINKQMWENDILNYEARQNNLFQTIDYFDIDIFNENETKSVLVLNAQLGSDFSSEAFTLNDNLQEEFSLIHPKMYIKGIIPNLFFIEYKEKIAACVMDIKENEEKIFRFSKSELPILLERHILKREFLRLESNVKNNKIICKFCKNGLISLGLSILESKHITFDLNIFSNEDMVLDYILKQI